MLLGELGRVMGQRRGKTLGVKLESFFQRVKSCAICVGLDPGPNVDFVCGLFPGLTLVSTVGSETGPGVGSDITTADITKEKFDDSIAAVHCSLELLQ